MGVPVYFHYCEGQLEKVNFVTKGESCCDDDGCNIPEEDNGCCKDETLVLQSATDALIKKNERVINPSSLLPSSILPHFTTQVLNPLPFCKVELPGPFATLHQQQLISSFLLRI